LLVGLIGLVLDMGVVLDMGSVRVVGVLVDSGSGVLVDDIGRG
jgi:hypothetical protein